MPVRAGKTARSMKGRTPQGAEPCLPLLKSPAREGPTIRECGPSDRQVSRVHANFSRFADRGRRTRGNRELPFRGGPHPAPDASREMALMRSRVVSALLLIPVGIAVLAGCGGPPRPQGPGSLPEMTPLDSAKVAGRERRRFLDHHGHREN